MTINNKEINNEEEKISKNEIFENKIFSLTSQNNSIDYDNILKLLIETKGKTFIENKLEELTKKKNYEPILDPNNHKFTAFPITYKNIWIKYKEQMESFWKAEEIDFSGDYDDFKLLNKDEQYFIEMILAFFAASDGIVNFNLSERFTREIQITEILFAYQFQIMMENIHCVAFGTKILTDKGYIKIGKNVSKTINVWNGKQFSKTQIRYTGHAQLYKIKLSNGMHLDCTPNHKWFVKSRNQPDQKKEIILTKNLKKGYIIYKYDLPIIDIKDPNEFLNPYAHGFFCGDGTYMNERAIINFCNKKKKNLLAYFNPKNYLQDKKNIRFFIDGQINKLKYFVPINYSIQTKLRWLEGICDSDGHINQNKKITISIQIANTNQKFLKKLQLMLTTLGIHSNLKNQKTGKSVTKFCKKFYNLYISSINVRKLISLGFNPKILTLNINLNIKEKSEFLKIKKISLLKNIHSTYCFNEPIEHAGIFNGILTGQSETYSLMLENIVKDPTRRNFLFDAIKNVESIKMMADWAFKWIESDASFAHRIIAFAIIEGVFFSGAFASIFWLKKYKNGGDKTAGKPFMNGLIESNKFIARDEGMHTLFACEIYNLLINKLSSSEINEMIMNACSIAKKFMTDALPIKLIGMNIDLMNNYIEYICDRLLSVLGYKKIYGTNNPFKFMETIGLDGKTNFHETRPTEYRPANGKKIIKITDEF
ncbi:Ribonucleoside-diphosphate reductase small subunit [uncultured virus]|nr:Ribonucleoside-diphosphate reductase small subunit [uncultured virus]